MRLPRTAAAQYETAAAYDVASFCRAHRISRAHFYNLYRRGEGPRIMKAGRRTLITERAAQEWREELERRSRP